MPFTDIQQDIFERRESKVRSYCRNFDTLFVQAQGSEMTDADGKTYIDFLAGCSTLNYGHNDPDMKAALIEHITREKAERKRSATLAAQMDARRKRNRVKRDRLASKKLVGREDQVVNLKLVPAKKDKKADKKAEKKVKGKK